MGLRCAFKWQAEQSAIRLLGANFREYSQYGEPLGLIGEIGLVNIGLSRHNTDLVLNLLVLEQDNPSDESRVIAYRSYI